MQRVMTEPARVAVSDPLPPSRSSSTESLLSVDTAGAADDQPQRGPHLQPPQPGSSLAAQALGKVVGVNVSIVTPTPAAAASPSRALSTGSIATLVLSDEASQASSSTWMVGSSANLGSVGNMQAAPLIPSTPPRRPTAGARQQHQQQQMQQRDLYTFSCAENAIENSAGLPPFHQGHAYPSHQEIQESLKDHHQHHHHLNGPSHCASSRIPPSPSPSLTMSLASPFTPHPLGFGPNDPVKFLLFPPDTDAPHTQSLGLFAEIERVPTQPPRLSSQPLSSPTPAVGTADQFPFPSLDGGDLVLIDHGEASPAAAPFYKLMVENGAEGGCGCAGGTTMGAALPCQCFRAAGDVGIASEDHADVEAMVWNEENKAVLLAGHGEDAARHGLSEVVEAGALELVVAASSSFSPMETEGFEGLNVISPHDLYGKTRVSAHNCFSDGAHVDEPMKPQSFDGSTTSPASSAGAVSESIGSAAATNVSSTVPTGGGLGAFSRRRAISTPLSIVTMPFVSGAAPEVAVQPAPCEISTLYQPPGEMAPVCTAPPHGVVAVRGCGPEMAIAPAVTSGLRVSHPRPPLGLAAAVLFSVSAHQQFSLTLLDLPDEVLTGLFLYLPRPGVLSLLHRRLHHLLMGDPVVLARWLLEHNHTVPRLWSLAPAAYTPSFHAADATPNPTTTTPTQDASHPTAAALATAGIVGSASKRVGLSTSSAGLGVAEDLRPILPSHPLLACLKHPSRHKLLRWVPQVATCLMRMAPRTSRYDLQRIHRRAVASDRGLYVVAEMVERRARELFGASVANTVSIAPVPRPTAPLPAVPVTVDGPVQATDPAAMGENFNAVPLGAVAVVNVEGVAIAATPVGMEAGPMMLADPIDHVALAAEPATAIATPFPTPPPESQAVASPAVPPSTELAKPPAAATPSVDDRRALLDAAVGGDSATVGVLIEACSLGLDARVVSEAFARAWDRGDPGNLCVPTGWLWPRCQASRWLVLERLAREDEDHAFAAMAAEIGFPNGVMQEVQQQVATVAGSSFAAAIAMTVPGGGAVMPAPIVVPSSGPDGDVVGINPHAVNVMTNTAVAVAMVFNPATGANTAPGLGPDGEIVPPAELIEPGHVGLGIVTTMARILAEAIEDERIARTRCRGLRNRMLRSPGMGAGWSAVDFGCRRMEACRLHGGRGRWGTLSTATMTSSGAWMSRRSFLDRALDAVVAAGSSRSVALIITHRPRLQPRHLTAALDRANLHIFCLLVAFGADPTWPEDPALSRYIRRPPSDVLAGMCWRHAFALGTPLTARRWEAALRLGPRATTACLDAWNARCKLAEAAAAGSGGGLQSYAKIPGAFDPTRHFGLGFRVGGPEVIRVLSDMVDAQFECGDVLAAASMGEPAALQYCIEVGQALAEALRDGDRDRAGDLLDAGALVLDDALCYSAAIADSPPGEWDEWPTAARCYRRVLVQQRLRLPLPSRDALLNLPQGVVTEALLCSLQATRPLCDPRQALVYARYQRRRHPNAAGIRINLVPVLEGDVSFRVVASAMQSLKALLATCDDPAYPGEAYCFIKGMLQFGLRDKNLLRDEDEYDEWDEPVSAASDFNSIPSRELPPSRPRSPVDMIISSSPSLITLLIISTFLISFTLLTAAQSTDLCATVFKQACLNYAGAQSAQNGGLVGIGILCSTTYTQGSPYPAVQGVCALCPNNVTDVFASPWGCQMTVINGLGGAASYKIGGAIINPSSDATLLNNTVVGSCTRSACPGNTLAVSTAYIGTNIMVAHCACAAAKGSFVAPVSPSFAVPGFTSAVAGNATYTVPTVGGGPTSTAAVTPTNGAVVNAALGSGTGAGVVSAVALGVAAVLVVYTF
ncbi:hypothetical protein HDU96_009399 [Phlyctochytrium bullatum]|nr:hypothetical protein HDU96_009399 [Phlyctochytrium bullatum]